MRALSMLCLLCVVGWMPADAKLSSIPIDELIGNASVIVIAKVTNLADVEMPPDPERLSAVVFADAIAQRTLKGTIPTTFRFMAQSGFICSETGAIKDELAMFFLYRSPQGVYSIMAAGNGRMALGEKDGKSFVTATSLIIFPKDAPTIDAMAPAWYKPTLVELAYVETRIRDVLKTRASR